MRSLSSYIFIASALVALGVSSCAPKSTESSMPEVSHQKHGKPGADIKLLSNSIIYVEPDQIVQPELLLGTNETSGQLHVELSVTEGLELLDTSTQLNAEINNAKPVQIPVKLRALREGRFYLHIQANVKSEDSISSRSLALIVQSGAETQKAIQHQKSSGDPVVSLPAQETTSSP